MITQDRQLKAGEVAKMLRVSQSSICKWINDGLINSYKTPGGHNRILAKDLASFLLGQSMPIPAELVAVADELAPWF